MGKFIMWTVSYKDNGKEKTRSCFSKKAAIYEYLNILEKPFNHGISDLKIFKDNTEYTGTLNRFLMR